MTQGLYNGREGYCAQIHGDLEKLQIEGGDKPTFCYGPRQLAAEILDEEGTPAWHKVGEALAEHLRPVGDGYEADCTLVELAAAAVNAVPAAYVVDWNLQHRDR
jgi:hypothetical protein